MWGRGMGACLVVVVCACAAADVPRSQVPAGCSVQRFGGPGTDEILAIVPGDDGAIAIAGSFEEEIRFGARTLRSAGGEDGYVAVISASGEIRWVAQIQSPGMDRGSALLIAPGGDVVASGLRSDGECFVARLAAADGRQIWRTDLAGGGTHLCRALAMTPASEIVVFGATQGKRAFGATTGPGSSTNDLLVARLSAVTGEVLSTRVLGGGGNDLGRAVVVADDGDLFIGGQFSGEVPPATGALDVGDSVLISHGDFDALLARLARDGHIEWARSFGGPGFDVLKSLTLDRSGDLLAVGGIQRPADYGGDLPFFTLGFDGFLARYSTAGEVVWRRDFLGKEVQAHDVAVDPAGRVWVVGHFKETVAVGDRTLSASGDSDLWVAAFADDGAVLWASAFGGVADEKGYAITATTGGIAIAGQFDGRTTMCGEDLDSRGPGDAYLLRVRPQLPPPPAR